MVNRPRPSISSVAVQIVASVSSADASLACSAVNSGSLSENTNVAVSVGEKPRVARVRESSVSWSRTWSQARSR